jgi:hypothetical protein
MSKDSEQTTKPPTKFKIGPLGKQSEGCKSATSINADGS